MKLTDKAIQKPRITLMAAAVLLLAGAFSLARIPVEQNPRLRIPVIFVVVPYPGAAPDEVEDQITRKVEKEIRGIEGVDEIRSVSQDGAGVVIVEFDDSVEIKSARRDVQQAVDKVAPEFPGETEKAIVRDIAFDDLPIIQISIYGPVGLPELKRIAEAWQEPLESITGVRGVEIFGGLTREVTVEADPQRLNRYGISLATVARSIARQHKNLPGGRIDLGNTELRLRTLGEYEGPDQIRDAVARMGHKRVLVSDLAEVDPWGHERVTSISRINGLPGVTLLIKKRSQINTLNTIRQIKEKVQELEGALPSGVQVAFTSDQSREIGYMVSQLSGSALFGSLLVIVLLCWAMGGRNAFLVGLAIPGSLLAGFVFLHLYGIVFSTICIFSLILILGMVVDGAIIVGENIVRHLEMGKLPRQASHDAMREIGFAVFSADLTTVAAFLPLLFVTGVTGQFMSVMPKVVAFTLLGSVIVDHYVLPVVASLLMKQRGAWAVGEPEKMGFVQRVVQGLYARVLASSLRHPFVVIGLLGMVTAAAGVVLVSGVLGSEFFPKVDVGRFSINVEMPSGSSIDRTNVACRAVEQVVLGLGKDELRNVVTTIGETGALNTDLREGGKSGPEHGRVMVELLQQVHRERLQKDIVNEVRHKLAGLVPGAKIHIYERREGPPVGSEIAIRLFHDDLDVLASASRKAERMMRESDFAKDVKNDLTLGRPELRVEVKRQMAALYGITAAQVAQVVATAYQGEKAAQMTIGDDEVDIRVRLSARSRADLETLHRLVLETPTTQIPLGEVAHIELADGLSEINRYNLKRTATLRCASTERYDTEEATLLLKRSLESARERGELPKELQIEYGGENEEQDEALASLRSAMGLAVLVVLSILVFQFNSFRQAFVILATVPLAMLGVVFGLLITGYKVGFLPFIGVVSLTGIVVNDAIVLVDFANQARGRGLGVVEALLAAGKTRLRPVILTTLTTIGGLLPLAFNISGGGGFWAPLCWSIISGLAMALLLTLVVVPVLYLLVEGRKSA